MFKCAQELTSAVKPGKDSLNACYLTGDFSQNTKFCKAIFKVIFQPGCSDKLYEKEYANNLLSMY